jgi:hypothetical protein
MVKEGVETAIDVANEATRILQTWDAQTAAAGRTTWFPELNKG